MRTHGAVVGRRFRSVTKLTTKVRIVRGYLWGSFLIAAAALKTPTRNGHNAQGVNLKFEGALQLGLSRGQFALFMYMSEFRFQLLTAITSDLPTIYQ